MILVKWVIACLHACCSVMPQEVKIPGKNNEKLLDGEKEALKNFIDEFTTVSTNECKVGARVSKIVLQVNIHCHTRSCRKYDCPCRFSTQDFLQGERSLQSQLQGRQMKREKKD